MKQIKIALIGIMVVAALALAGCMLPIAVDAVDPIDPVDPIAPVLTVPVAAFSYYCTPPIQTDSWILFDGRDSYDPDDEIMWGEWDFDDGTIEEGTWMETVKEWENGEWVWVQYSVTAGAYHNFNATGLYTVTLTVWDYDGNQDSTTRNIRVE